MGRHQSSSLDLFIDPSLRNTKRDGIETAIRIAIRDGRLRPGTRLPSTRSLAQDLGVARATVSDAYGQLCAEGYLAIRQGAQPTVAWIPPVAEAAPPAQAHVAPAARWDLRPGRTDTSSFPRDAWIKATREVLAGLAESDLDYGDPRGVLQLRTALADYLGRARGVRASPGSLMVCSGFTQALWALCIALRAAGAQAIAVEDPGAIRARDIICASGLKVVGVSCDSQGIRVSELRDTAVAAVLVTPAHQYPLGATLSPERRGELLGWARAAGTLVIEDDYDGEFRFDRRPVGALQQLDSEHVVYIGTASKSMAPGLRLGWAALPDRLRESVIAAKEQADRGNSAIDQCVLAHLIETGDFDRHIRRMRANYQRRRNELLGLLNQRTPSIRPVGIAAGMQVILSLPSEMTEELVIAEAFRRDLLLHALSPYRIRLASTRMHAVIAGYGTPSQSSFRPAIGALANALEAASTMQ
jgi:GntR family transcriptional regulator/MocR family aminotransferase